MDGSMTVREPACGHKIVTHLLAAELGGSNTDPRNFVAATTNANKSSFRKAEILAKSLTNAGYGVDYELEAHYDPGKPIRRLWKRDRQIVVYAARPRSANKTCMSLRMIS